MLQNHCNSDINDTYLQEYLSRIVMNLCSISCTFLLPYATYSIYRGPLQSLRNFYNVCAKSSDTGNLVPFSFSSVYNISVKFPVNKQMKDRNDTLRVYCTLFLYAVLKILHLRTKISFFFFFLQNIFHTTVVRGSFTVGSINSINFPKQEIIKRSVTYQNHLISKKI